MYNCNLLSIFDIPPVKYSISWMRSISSKATIIMSFQINSIWENGSTEHWSDSRHKPCMTCMTPHMEYLPP